MLIPLTTLSRENNLAVDQYNGNIYTSFRPQELNGHTRAELWFLKSTDGGATWSMSKAYQGPAGSDVGNVFPAMAVDRGGKGFIPDSGSTFQNGDVAQLIVHRDALDLVDQLLEPAGEE